MIKIIKELFKFNRTLLGEGCDNALEYLKHLIDLDIIEVDSGEELETWNVPDEWVIRDGWVKFKGKKIIDYKKNPLSIAVNSKPVHKKMKLEELKKHLYVSDEMPDKTPYEYLYYKDDWGVCLQKNKVLKKLGCEGGTCMPELKELDSEVGKVQVEGEKEKYKELLKKGEYEVFIDSEFKPGKLKIGVHTIKGKTDREILLLAHLDHPNQANDNLSGVACLIDMAKRLKKQGFDHTIKLVFCPETIGSIAYGVLQDISKVDFVISVDAIGNDNTLLIQKAFDREAKINKAVHLAVHGKGVNYRKGEFRHLIGSDEYFFNDPEVGIPGIMLSRFPFKEYHTEADTPDIIDIKKIKEVQEVIIDTIDIMEKDFIPIRCFTGPLMRAKYGVQTPYKLLNRDMDYFFYDMDGKKSIMDLVVGSGMTFEYAYDLCVELEKARVILRK